MQHPIIRRWLAPAGVAVLAAGLAACAANPPPAAYSYAPPPGGFSGSSTPPAAANLNGGYGYGSSEPAAPRHFVTSRATPMRDGPRNGFDIRAVLPAGTAVSTDGYVSGDWWQVQSRYGTGWVYSRDLSAS
jgi:hypothetical protein